MSEEGRSPRRYPHANTLLKRPFLRGAKEVIEDTAIFITLLALLALMLFFLWGGSL